MMMKILCSSREQNTTVVKNLFGTDPLGASISYWTEKHKKTWDLHSFLHKFLWVSRIGPNNYCHFFNLSEFTFQSAILVGKFKFSGILIEIKFEFFGLLWKFWAFLENQSDTQVLVQSKWNATKNKIKLFGRINSLLLSLTYQTIFLFNLPEEMRILYFKLQKIKIEILKFLMSDFSLNRFKMSQKWRFLKS